MYGNLDQSSTEFIIDKLLAKRNAQYAIIANAIEKGNQTTNKISSTLK